MVFSSTVFLFLFLPIVIFSYIIVPQKGKNDLLLLSSLFFYAWGEPLYISILLISIICNYSGALLISKYKNIKNIILCFFVFVNIIIIFTYKYLNFAIETINQLWSTQIPSPHLTMPIGISFFTFQAISYLVDVYRDEVKARRNFYDVALYISFFPQLIAGPIVKYHDISSQIDYRITTLENIVYGTRRFIFGLGKKVLIANTVGEVADTIFALSSSELDSATAWLGAICYTVQIYFDFSGYSDMAIGLGAIFGFKFKENFNYPYISKSITEFWRRWHISLSTWFRDYVYIPLGGNRKGKTRTLLNLSFVFLLTGIWHGASWCFIIWGCWHGFFIILERILRHTYHGNHIMLMPVKFFYTIFVVIIGWVIFRAESLSFGLGYLTIMFMGNNIIPPFNLWAYLTNMVILSLMIGCIGSTPFPSRLKQIAVSKLPARYDFILNTSLNITAICILLISISSIAAGTYNPFIYFRF